MRYAIKFYQGCRVLNKADEIIIKYTEKSENLLKFVQEYKEEQRIVVDVTMINDFTDSLRIFKEAMVNHKNFAILVSKTQNYIDLYEANIPFFFYEPADTLDELENQIKLGVTDVYIVNNLGFNLEKVFNKCTKENVKIRVFPNVAQSIKGDNGNSFKKFYIRPEDVDFYEDYVDTFEFFGPIDRQPVLYNIYNSKTWLGNLNDLILDLHYDINNETIAPYFGISRVKCKKRCNENRCKVCDTIISFSKVLNESGLSIGKVKDEHEINAEYLSEKAERLKETFKELSGKSEL